MALMLLSKDQRSWNQLTSRETLALFARASMEVFPLQNSTTVDNRRALHSLVLICHFIFSNHWYLLPPTTISYHCNSLTYQYILYNKPRASTLYIVEKSATFPTKLNNKNISNVS